MLEWVEGTISVCLSVYPSLSPPLCLSIRLSLSLAVCMSFEMSQGARREGEGHDWENK